MPRATLPTGIELEFETFGDLQQPALLLVNGYTSQMLGWPADLADLLASQGLFVIRFDNRDVEWQAEAMYEYARQHDSPEMKAHNEFIKSYTAESEQARATMSLKELLQRQNDFENERMNMDLYLATNSIGVGDGYSGAVSTASWWERNFYMYANIQKLAVPGERVIAIGGSGHMAILKQLLAIDSRLEGISVDSYL